MKRIISILAALCLLLTMMPMSVFARTTDPTQEWEIPVQVNPLYADVLDRQEAAEKLAAYSRPNRYFGEPVYVSEEEAVQQLRDQMKIRNTSVTLYVQTTNPDFGDVYGDIFEEALEHTGVPTEGDYLAWQYGAMGGGVGGYSEGDVYYMTLNYSIMYYNDAAQEAELNATVDALLDELHLDGLTDYEKVCGIYKYMTENIEYDYDHLEADPNYYPMYTAYAALVNGTSVCQGYANLFYRLALEVGVDCRIVTGNAGGPHAWNLVEIDGTYYYVDSTWDATYAQAGYDYQWFLKGSDNFTQDHTPSLEESPFVTSYPISQTDYDPSNSGQPEEPERPEMPETDYLAVEWEILKLTNRERQKKGRKILTTHKTLFEAADIRAWEITEYFSNVERPDRSNSYTVMDDVGFPWDGYTENIAAGQLTVEEVIAAWMNEPASRSNMLFYNNSHMGVGYRQHDDAHGQYWVQVFSVVYDDCWYTGMELNEETIEVEKGTELDDLQLWATAYCNCCGECYLPILEEYCTGYDPNKIGVQTVTVSCLGYTDTLTIKVRSEEPGDANGDGGVNVQDLILLRQHLAGWDVTIEDTADANGDGSVDALDLILLRQHLAGWDVTLGK